MIYSHIIADRVLGALIQDTNLCLNSKYPIEKEDFECVQFHKILFSTIYNLAIKGVKIVTLIDMEEFLKPYDIQYNICKDNNFEDYLTTIIELGNKDNYEYYYNELRKYSCLREYKEQGFDITEIYDESKEDNSGLNGWKIEDIVGYFDKKQSSIKRTYIVDDETTRKKAGDNGIQILKRFKDSPQIGLSFESKFLTTLWDGWQKKQLYIRSGDTSSGKSRSCIGDLACACAKEIYDIKEKKWVENPNGINRGLYLGCEMELNQECDPLVWSYISGVDSAKITKGRSTKEEDKIVERAIKVINDDSIWLTDMPSFNINKLEEEIKYHKHHCNIDYVAFDYILINSALVKEFVQNRGSSIGARGDEILLELSEGLKNLCKKYDVGMITATQTNADIKDYRNRDYQVIRGGKGVADKATGASISMPITQQELKLVEPYIQNFQKRGFGNGIEVNWVETAYKARFSEFPKECKIFSYYDLGNMRKEEFFVTDKNFKPIKIDKTIVQMKKEN